MRKQNGYLLPDSLVPERICFRVSVPNDPQSISAFLGQLSELSYWYNWERDPTHFGKPVSKVWRDEYEAVIANYNQGKFRVGTCDDSPPVPRSVFSEVEDAMPLRVDCDCNVWVTCCDGTEKQILTAEQVKAITGGSLTPNAPQPTPGGCQEYTFQINGSQTTLLPAPVSTGDTIEIMSYSGASNVDGTLNWKCPDGLEYFAGACVGFGAPLGTNYVPAANTGKVVALIAGLYYDITIGTPFTVPGGVSLAPVQLILNYTPGQSISGQVNGIVKVCDNTPVGWTHTLDFRYGMYGFDLLVVGADIAGAWGPGTGIVATSFNGFAVCYGQGIEFERHGIPAFNLDSIFLDLDYALGADACGDADQYIATNSGGSDNIQVNNHAGAIVSGAGLHLGGSTPYASQTAIRIQMFCADDHTPPVVSGACTIKSMTITGHGFDPF